MGNYEQLYLRDCPLVHSQIENYFKTNKTSKQTNKLTNNKNMKRTSKEPMRESERSFREFKTCRKTEEKCVDLRNNVSIFHQVKKTTWKLRSGGKWNTLF